MAEVVFTGGAVITVTGEHPEEEALAMREGRIVAVGSWEEVLADQAPDAIVVDLDGRALLPGFVEAHGHPLQVVETLAPPALDVRPFGTPTAEGVERHMREAVQLAPGQERYYSGDRPFLRSSSRACSVFFRSSRPVPPNTSGALVNWISPYSTTCQRLPHGSRKSRPLPGSISMPASLRERRTALLSSTTRPM